MQASYEVSLMIAKQKKAYTIGENLILPAAKAMLLMFARYVGNEGNKEEFLMNAALEATTKGEDIFQVVDSFFKQHGLTWENLRGCTTDGAPAMLGQRSGFRARFMEVAPHVTCIA
ncbi:protein FAM200C-like [Macrobrachium rosenbergii]|uniref:protein FAM200C-like n=1 Tax=Macrobrachium rosenbergii TaxID=79674 RepID=UPI0034D4AA17